MKIKQLGLKAVIYYALCVGLCSASFMACSGGDEEASEAALASQAEADAAAAEAAAAAGNTTVGSNDVDDDGDSYTENGGDCDDSNKAISPAAAEVCDDVDNDCDDQTDEDQTQYTYYADTDGDGYGNSGSTTSDCSLPSGYAANDDDCNDSSSSIKPGVTEVCDDKDNDCDGSTDEGLTEYTYYADADGDGFGDRETTTSDCSLPSGYSDNLGDCDDTDGSQPTRVVDKGDSKYYDTIQGAIDGAEEGDCIAVRPDEYQENIEITQYVTLNSTDGAELTIVNGGAADSVFEIDFSGYSGSAT